MPIACYKCSADLGSDAMVAVRRKIIEDAVAEKSALIEENARLKRRIQELETDAKSPVKTVAETTKPARVPLRLG